MTRLPTTNTATQEKLSAISHGSPDPASGKFQIPRADWASLNRFTETLPAHPHPGSRCPDLAVAIIEPLFASRGRCRGLRDHRRGTAGRQPRSSRTRHAIGDTIVGGAEYNHHSRAQSAIPPGRLKRRRSRCTADPLTRDARSDPHRAGPARSRIRSRAKAAGIIRPRGYGDRGGPARARRSATDPRARRSAARIPAVTIDRPAIPIRDLADGQAIVGGECRGKAGRRAPPRRHDRSRRISAAPSKIMSSRNCRRRRSPRSVLPELIAIGHSAGGTIAMAAAGGAIPDRSSAPTLPRVGSMVAARQPNPDRIGAQLIAPIAPRLQ